MTTWHMMPINDDDTRFGFAQHLIREYHAASAAADDQIVRLKHPCPLGI
jgi:hypothetical protein